MNNHNHDGVNSEKIKSYNVIPNFKMPTAELAFYLSRKAIDGDIFTNFDGTNYELYIRINAAWKKATLS